MWFSREPLIEVYEPACLPITAQPTHADLQQGLKGREGAGNMSLRRGQGH
jgi:hypothetical protein